MSELELLRELVKSKTPATLTQAQAERMPPEVWYSREDYDKLKASFDAAVTAERERCAQIADNCWPDIGEHHESTCCGEFLAAAIREEPK